MSPSVSHPVPGAVFLSYAREDADAARRIADALRAFGVEAWFDEAELRGGDAWDAKIKKQIRECALFMPMISAKTQARAEGYFRREWKLAVERTHDMAAGVAFIVPVVVDDTREGEAAVPEEFMRVQWTRLAHGVPSPQFVEQVTRLLGTPRKAAAVPRAIAPSISVSPRAGVPAWVMLVAIVAIGGGATYFATRSSPTTARPLAAPLSESRQLVEKARKLYEQWDLASRDDFVLADELLKRAVTLDPTDGDAWAHAALVSCGEIMFFIDDSEERRQTAKLQGDRALKLAPELDLARFAHALVLRYYSPQTIAEAVRLLREEVVRQPNNRLVVRMLANSLRASRDYEQALVYIDKAIALPGRDPIVHYNRYAILQEMGRFAEAEAEVDEALALAPGYATANRGKLSLLLDYHEDLPRARAFLEKLPPSFLSERRNCYYAALVAYYSRDGAKCLTMLQQAPEYFSVEWGPRAVFTARAHRLLGNEDAARTDFRAALRMLDELLAKQPNSGVLLWWRATILAYLGETAAAEPLVRELRQRIKAGEQSLTGTKLATTLMALGRKDEALGELEMDFANPNKANGARMNIRYDVLWDPLRGNPRFEALLSKAPAKK